MIRRVTMAGRRGFMLLIWDRSAADANATDAHASAHAENRNSHSPVHSLRRIKSSMPVRPSRRAPMASQPGLAGRISIFIAWAHEVLGSARLVAYSFSRRSRGRFVQDMPARTSLQAKIRLANAEKRGLGMGFSESTM